MILSYLILLISRLETFGIPINKPTEIKTKFVTTFIKIQLGFTVIS